jgi:DMSO/TMAO reductase YedYZ molybdopterin-dependent catalytic subunit
MRARGIRFPWANIALLVLLSLQLATGLVGLLGSSEPFRWASWLHAIGAYGIVVLLFAKGTLVLNAIRRRPGLTQARVVLSVLVLMLLATLVTGLVWITAGSTIYVAGISLVNLHAYIALALFALLAWHAIDRRWIVRVPAARDRAAFLRLAGVVVAGLALWQVERTAQRLLETPGSRRRFTGSYETGSFTGEFPVVRWLNDDPEPLDEAAWRLIVDGSVRRPLELTYDEVLDRSGPALVATLDCTGGWYTKQEWGGLELAALFDEAEVSKDAESVLVESTTGFSRRFSLGDARRLTLATHVAGEPLSHGHGFPLRLVVPDQRGFDWVKWVTRVHVSGASHLWQPPLPLA